MCTVAALIGDPWLLLFDEPSNGLDGDGVSAVLEILSRRTKGGKGAVVSTNDEPFASRLGGTRYVIRDGRWTVRLRREWSRRSCRTGGAPFVKKAATKANPTNTACTA